MACASSLSSVALYHHGDQLTRNLVSRPSHYTVMATNSRTQVAGTAAAYFAGKTDVILLRFSISMMTQEADLEVHWEDAAPASGAQKRDGDFPHVYGGPIPYACLAAPPDVLVLGPDGKHVLPSLGPKPRGPTETSMLKALEGDRTDDDTADGRDVWNPNLMNTEDEVLAFNMVQDAAEEASQ